MGNVSFHPDVFRIFLGHLRETFKSAGDAMVYSMAKDFSSQAMLLVGKQLGVSVDMPPVDIVELFSDRMRESGWGLFVVRRMDLEDLVFDVELMENPFPEIVDEPGSLMCYFYRGVLCGFFEYLTRRPMVISGPETLSVEGNAVFHLSGG